MTSYVVVSVGLVYGNLRVLGSNIVDDGGEVYCFYRNVLSCLLWKIVETR